MSWLLGQLRIWRARDDPSVLPDVSGIGRRAAAGQCADHRRHGPGGRTLMKTELEYIAITIVIGIIFAVITGCLYVRFAE